MSGKTRTWRRVLVALAAIVFLTAGVIYVLYSHDMLRIKQSVASQSDIAETRHGPIEYTSQGSGPAVLVVHGAGGGYDQGALLWRTMGSKDFRWIAVSRFGYLRSVLPTDATTVDQAEAFADLLDVLKVDRVSVLAMSGGVPPALQFAQHFPERTNALVLLSSAPYTPLTASEQDMPIPAWMYHALFSSDFAFWAIVKLSPATLYSIFDVSPELRENLNENELAFLSGLVEAFLPVTGRTPGLRNEGAAVDPRAHYNLKRIAAPTLVIHAKDDGINSFAVGEYTARHVDGAEFMPLQDGGHLLLGHIQEVRNRVNSFLRAHTATSEQ